MTEPSVNKVLIVGGGTAGWMAAASLASIMPHISVDLVESEEIGIVGVGEATIPQINLFNATIGITDAEMTRETEATFKLGIEFVDWHRPGARYLHPFGAFGVPINGLDFWHYWIRAELEGRPSALHEYNANSVAAYAGRFANVARQNPNSPLSKLFSAYHFDASLYAKLLRRIAEERGVTRIEGKITHCERDTQTGHLARVALADGRTLTADLFIDCSGFRSLLLGEAMGVGFRDWSKWLPCDRALAVPTERTGEPLPYTRSTAKEAGWVWRIPLQHRTGNGYVYSSAHISDDEAAKTLLGSVDGTPLADLRQLRFKAGHREKFWEGNVVALGLAGGFLEPLESTSIHLVQVAISRLITLFPRSFPAPGAEAEFNRLSTLDYEGVRDFLIFHYWANERPGEFWRDRREMTPPTDTFHQRIELFREAGHLARAENELFAEASWLAVMLGQGIMPRGYNRLADLVSADEMTEIMMMLRTRAAQAVATLPTHMDYVSAVRSGAASVTSPGTPAG